MTPTDLITRLRTAATLPESQLRGWVRGIAEELEGETDAPCDPLCPVCNDAAIPDAIVAGDTRPADHGLPTVTDRITRLERANDRVALGMKELRERMEAVEGSTAIIRIGGAP